MPVIREETRPLGVVYTPSEVAAPMARLALAPLVEGRRAHEILALRVCDPAMGTGAFLVQVVATLVEHLVAAWDREPASAPQDRAIWARAARRLVVTQCIAGVDIDEQAIAIARRELAADDHDLPQHGQQARDRDLPRHGQQARDRDLPEHERQARDRDVAQREVDNLRVADALALDWAAAFPEVFARGGFDVVLANPPYIRQERLGRKTALTGFEVYDGVADLYVYFVELAHRLLRAGGRYCVIVPNKWLTVEYGRPLRTFLAGTNSVDGLVDLAAHPLFAEADAFPCIVWGTAGAPVPRPVRAIRAHPSMTVAAALVQTTAAEVVLQTTAAEVVLQTTAADSLQTTAADSLQTTAAADLPLQKTAPVDARDAAVVANALHGDPDALTTERERFTGEPWHIDTPTERALLERLERTLPTLGARIGTRWSRGVVTGLNAAFVLDRETRDRLVERDSATAALVRRFIKGRDVRAYRPGDGARWLLMIDRGTAFDELPAGVREHLTAFRARLEPRPAEHRGPWAGRKPGAYAWHELQDPVVPLAKSRAPRLFYQDIQTSPACCLDATGELVPDTTVWILPSDDRVLLAILNSPFYGWYAKRRFPPALNGAVRPKLSYMQRLPVPEPSADLRREIEALVDARLAANDAEMTSVATDGATKPSTVERLATREAAVASGARTRAQGVRRVERLAKHEATAADIDARLATLIENAYALTATERALIEESAD